MTNPIRLAHEFGQSIWYDNIRRGLLTSGELRSMVENDGLRGVTSNPAIFEKALGGSTDYDDELKDLVRSSVGDAKALYERLAISDIQQACDVLRPVFDESGGGDGHVSLEVSPHLATDTDGTIEEARRLHAAVDRPNVIIKVPGTPEGMPAIAQLIGEGISVNVTLLFAIDAYVDAAEAYMEGLERLLADGGDPKSVASVASFFLSRIDTMVDEQLEAALARSGDDQSARERVQSLFGKAAIANAKLAYAKYEEMSTGERWTALSGRRARPQRLLWASTSTKSPSYPDTMYVDALIGPDTVNTVPEQTYLAFQKVQDVRPTLTEGRDEARAAVQALAELGISLDDVAARLLDDGLRKFREPFDKLVSAVEKKRRELLDLDLAGQSFEVPDDQAAAAFEAELERWRAEGNVRRLWKGDASLWTGADESEWLGWLHCAHEQAESLEPLQQLADRVRDQGIEHVVLLGMGGSSLGPWVLRETFGRVSGFPDLRVLDSIVPAQVRSVHDAVDLEKTLFVVSSKSGTTSEPNVLLQHFLHAVAGRLGAEEAGQRFVAVTDPGSRLEQLAERERFLSVRNGVPSVGGRYSVLSPFGVVPAALMGLDVKDFLDRAELMVQSCASVVPPEDNPGVSLGVLLGTLAGRGRDKLTIIASPGVASLGAWLEQLVAESTGKQGKGLVPIADEQLAAPVTYGSDRLFVHVRDKSSATAAEDDGIAALVAAGHPVVRISLDETLDLGQEFFRWEIATAAAGAVMGINPFDQPDVEASKVKTRELTAAYEESGQAPDETPLLEDGTIRVFADERNAKEVSGGGLEDVLARHFARAQPGDYVAFNAFLEQGAENHEPLQAMRHAVRDARKIATTLGYGPRFLHSTGQLHVGGPNTGVFLHLTSDDAADLPVPGKDLTFGLLKRFQAQGNFDVLAERGRRLLRVHLGADVASDLARLREIVERVAG